VVEAAPDALGERRWDARPDLRERLRSLFALDQGDLVL
jgi:hypothetical protein